MSLQPHYIAPLQSGLIKNKKPFLFIENAFQELNNAYCFRERIKKREGLRFLGRLRRNLTAEAIGDISAAGAGTFTFNIFTGLGVLTDEPDASLEPGDLTNISIVIGAPISQTLNDAVGTGIMTIVGAGLITQANINYETGVLTLVFSAAAAASAATFTGAYYPGLPVMGIGEIEIANINEEDSIYFDTIYSYVWNGVAFTQFGTATWSGTNSDFFWTTNWRGTNPYNRLFFATNFVADGNNPIRYYDGSWNDFSPTLDSSGNVLGQARIILPYYGRLLALNTFEGPAPGIANNFFNRCRFSQIGDPLQADAWRSDIFGKGGFIDAPVNEEIVSAIFYKNVLIVFFEQTTWQLRYVGEYGFPFLWERISSDFGCESTFSPILFDQGVFSVGDKAIIATDSNAVTRMDLDIPDEVFGFNNRNDGVKRVVGVRDYFKELVSWSFSRSQDDNYFYPDSILLYNYRNNTWAKFRTNSTFFGTQREINGITWNRDDIFWDDDTVFWDDVDSIQQFQKIVLGNQQGFVSYYMDTGQDQQSLHIQDIDLTAVPIRITSADHNLYTNEIIFIDDLKFLNAAQTAVQTTDLNEKFYQINVIDEDTFDIYGWDQTTKAFISDFTFTTPTDSVYAGSGTMALIPRMEIITKDFNPLESQGIQFKSSYIDFQTDSSPGSAVTIFAYVNSSLSESANLPVWNPNMETQNAQSGLITAASQANPCQITAPNHGLLTGREITIENVLGMTELNNLNYTITFVDADNFTLDSINSTAFTAYISGGSWSTVDINPFYTELSSYAWHRFYSNVFGQYLTYEITYSDELMNNPVTHNSRFEMNAITLWIKPAGRRVI